ncbi:fungal specific transcription factor domain-containing protein [Trichoderma breve]|uniref:Fungal specific transcription factor domain-containing protein n=1 Tax=Trichoderma breve TaxID=2034170 RepID=A0A9W9EEY6_9HYPO|nr:fungal specific transcription factor domain-containing protein [Trichoderma breve]KAJ4865434.1 fungal specific transcription factor domain-containing protein [Trichoderma breve]
MEFGPRKIEKRNRAPVSCEPCRARKQMCNRGQPCEGCTRRNQASLCRYAPNAIRNKARPPKVGNIQERLDNLEVMLASIAANPAAAGIGIGAAPDNHALPPELPHRHESGDGQVSYIDPSHWRAILDEIKEVREHLSAFDRPLAQEEPERKSVASEDGAGFMFGKFPVVDLEDIISTLPPRSACDALVAQYFNARFMVLGILHPVKFQREYEKFWDAPLKAPPLWIALLFSVLSLTTTLRNVAGGSTGPKSARPTAKTLQQRTVECLILGRFPNANAYALEAMILHLQSCYLTLNRLGSDHWFEMGTLIRLAFRMGYHHDPDGLPGISVFDGEMRRRVWHNIFQVDALMYPIAKSGVMAVFKRIVAHSQSLSLPTYDNTIMLDNEMREAYNNLPEILRGRDVGRSFMDPSNIIFERCTIEMLYLKGLIVLHRRYISYEVDGRRFEHSRRTCAEAALDILARQADLHQACQPGGRLYDDRWMVSSLTMHDFLLAAMVICLDLSVRLRRPSSVLVPGKDDDALTGREYHALQRSQTIWASSSQMSPEARLASLALGLMVQKVADKDARHIHLSKAPEEDLAAAASTQELPYAGPMSQMIDGTEGLDWGLLDQYFQNQPTDASQLDPFSIDPGWFDLPL